MHWRVLVVDDNPELHVDYKAILSRPAETGKLDALELELFGEPEEPPAPAPFPKVELVCAHQGEEAVEWVERTQSPHERFFLAFVDIRMPPGIDGVETVKRLWQRQPSLFVVLCSAYADYGWSDIARELGVSPNLLFLRKPFEPVEVKQIISSMMAKYEWGQLAQQKQAQLEQEVEARTEELRAYQQGLEATIERRTSELVAMRDEAVQASKAKSVFLANMSHELRTPLNVIIGYAELLQESLADWEEVPAGLRDEFHSDLEKILASGQYLLRLLSGILDLSKIEAEKIELHLESVALLPWVEELCASMRPLFARQNNSCKLSPVPDVAMLTDPTKLKQILLNLLDNANRFTEGGEIRLEVSLKSHEQRAGVEFRVEDTGIGITPAQMQTIFEPFYQARSQRHAGVEGVGLGLTISARFCQLLGGALYAESEPHKGACFFLWLPLTHLC